MTRLFPDALAPWATDPRVAHARTSLRARALSRYLRGTELLETRVVNPVFAAIAHDGGPFGLGPSFQAEAAELLEEEQRHADDARDLRAALDLPDPGDWEPPYLANALALCPADHFLFVVVTETVISVPLRTLSSDPGLHPDVRAYAQQHARDEARHARFFVRALASVWDEAQQPTLTRFAAAFLAPDPAPVLADLLEVGLGDADANAIVAATCGRAAHDAAIRHGTRPMRRQLAGAGLLESR